MRGILNLKNHKPVPSQEGTQGCVFTLCFVQTEDRDQATSYEEGSLSVNGEDGIVVTLLFLQSGPDVCVAPFFPCTLL